MTIAPPRPTEAHRGPPDTVYDWTLAVVGVAVAGLILASRPPGLVDVRLVSWWVVIAVVELFPVETGEDSRFTVTDPILFALAFIHGPFIAFVVTFLGACDLREIRREVSMPRALANRGLVAGSAAIAGAAFQSISRLEDSWPVLVTAALVGTVSFYVVNLSLAATGLALRAGRRPIDVARQLLLDAPIGSTLGYVSFGLLGMLIARLYSVVDGGEWIVASAAVPSLILSRQTFLHLKRAREEANQLRSSEAAAREMADRIKSEREDERRMLAAALHDQVIPVLEGINLLAATGKALVPLADEHSEKVKSVLEDVRRNGQTGNEILRSIVAGLRSEFPRGDLRVALEQVANAMTRQFGVHISLESDTTEPLDPTEESLLFDIAREAVVNAARHAEASKIGVVVRCSASEGLILSVTDDGVGFEPRNIPEGHFGLLLIRERATALGAQLSIVSGQQGTTVKLHRSPNRRSANQQGMQTTRH